VVLLFAGRIAKFDVPVRFFPDQMSFHGNYNLGTRRHGWRLTVQGLKFAASVIINDYVVYVVGQTLSFLKNMPRPANITYPDSYFYTFLGGKNGECGLKNALPSVKDAILLCGLA
jgi:hypothetical protein